MKYYKRIADSTNYLKKDIIYPLSAKEMNKYCVSLAVENFPYEWEEVREIDYLLQEAKKNYPKGTEVYPVYYDGSYGNDPVMVDPKDFREINDTSIDAGIFKFYLYANEVWAKKVETPSTRGEEEFKSYMIDTSKEEYNEFFVYRNTKEEEFVLPEKWYIQRDDSNYNIVNKWFNENQPIDMKWVGNNGLMNYPHYSSNQIPNEREYILKERGYTEITFEEFKRYVLKENMEEREIIGYKLVKPEFRDAVKAIVGEVWFNEYWDNNLKSRGVHFTRSNILYTEYSLAVENKLYHAGVLDLWFEPVYEEKFKVGDWVIGWFQKTDNNYHNIAWEIGEIDGKYVYPKKGNGIHNTRISSIRKATEEEIRKAKYPDISIIGYKAEFFDTYVSFGCQSYKRDFVIQLSDMLEKNNFSMAYRKEVKKIADYYKNK